MGRSCSPSRFCTPITSSFGGGFSVTHRKWNSNLTLTIRRSGAFVSRPPSILRSPRQMDPNLSAFCGVGRVPTHVKQCSDQFVVCIPRLLVREFKGRIDKVQSFACFLRRHQERCFRVIRCLPNFALTPKLQHYPTNRNLRRHERTPGMSPV